MQSVGYKSLCVLFIVAEYIAIVYLRSFKVRLCSAEYMSIYLLSSTPTITNHKICAI